MKRVALPVTALCTLPAAGLAQTSVSPASKYSWSENVGWMNWRDAGLGSLGVADKRTFLSGWIWCENIGWISLGDGTPSAGAFYSNSIAADFGVNIGASGELSGYGWSENAGWINFGGGALASPAQPARIDFAANRLRGYAWSPNLGWINLNDATRFIALTCYANCDGSTGTPALTANDFQCFLNKYAAADPAANCDRSTGSPLLTANDFQCFLNTFAAGCT
ncbi:MAG: hypothetical protein KF678_13850 [Phycisphaeraceae bacterium]|nr:hypothetical protein [Phycisphaeraceae bacterium]